ncbi:CBS domain-containing protein [Candidatus Solirubrobacter pratensis]|uniref:CBS domain-containing protein n=1 Tax=Candidatus Solirubrobacter pratensis TaxID=1298857 RepID=UPI0004872EA8|nr:CBS domain-containing protein [Candidatus Solirubrobacter pratensis]
MRVRDAMTENVLTFEPGRTLRDAARFMTDHTVGAVVIIDPEQPGPGIVTERDLVRSLGNGQDPDTELVGDHLTANAAFADADWDLQEAADAMARGGFRHLVVVVDGALQGIISMRDIMRVWRPGP